MSGKTTRQQLRAAQRAKQTDPKPPPRGRSRTWWMWVVAAALVALVVVVLVTRNDSPRDGGKSTTTATAGLPDTPDYHSLVVAPNDPRRVFLGTHAGLFSSADGGRTWRATDAISGDVMNLARVEDSDVIYAAGHDLLQRSDDGGRTWSEMSPSGLPSLDVHGFTTDPSDPKRLYAAIAGAGLFRSTDGGASFSKVNDVGGGAMGAGAGATASGTAIYLGDMQQGLIVSKDGGRSFDPLDVNAVSVAVDRSDSGHVIAGGEDIYYSDDGTEFRKVASNGKGFGPVAFAPSDSKVAYAIGYDQQFYVSSDGGKSWTTR